MWTAPRDKKRHQEPILGAIYDLRNEHSYLMHTLACVQTSLQKSSKVHFHPVGSQCTYKIRPYKNTADNKLKKKRFLCLKTLSMSNQFVLV